jgi:hypothetical protein
MREAANGLEAPQYSRANQGRLEERSILQIGEALRGPWTIFMQLHF